ncbi:iron complex transport system substrate-binding protein [Nocardia tenerifensis]|uniref:Iron complex transport system substrate-binding protein n=1 Tax=Nocardia tenerifensis TaxID=228006 RepID=A0A318KL11_9NOCA|nr:ABC transporter substrate-binding protein [Nocardia tenerifensis]PXX69117.1 iron complex transport system substrate-binding protein [Nocardia tenerifensis]
MLRQHALLPALAAATLAVTGCTTSVTDATDNRPSSATEGVVEYPVSLENCGKTYTYTEAPRRVVVMNGGSVGEVTSLLALGVADRVVANAQSYGASDVPGRAAAIDALPTGGFTKNDLQDIPREAMLNQRPDLVISTGGGGFAADLGFATRADLAAAGANTYVPRTNCGATTTLTGTPTIEDSYAMLRDFGTIFDVRGRADRLIADSRRAVAETAARVAGQPKKNVLLAFAGMGAGDFSAIAADGVWNDVMDKAGAVNPFRRGDGAMFASIDKEQLAATPIDGLVVVNHRTADIDTVAQRMLAQFPQWPATKTNSYAVLSDSVYFGPSNDIGVRRIASLVHPELFR